jgi:hypothetical protein
MSNKYVAAFIIAVGLILSWQQVAIAQLPAAKSQPKLGKGKSSIKAVPQTGMFHPTCNLDSNSVGFYFFPANLGAKWTLRTVSQYLDAANKLLKSDTAYSFERVISDSNRTLQGLPVLGVESSMPYHAGEEAAAKVERAEYYVDDSVVMTVFNHSVTSGQNHFLLVNPLKVGASWKDVSDDTIRSQIIATDESVSVPVGDFNKSIVVQTAVGFGSLSKYFVPGVGIVKTVFRGIPPAENGTYVVTSELIELDRGNEKRSIKRQFESPTPVKARIGKKMKHGITEAR